MLGELVVSYKIPRKKQRRINREAYARRRDTTEYVGGRNCLLCKHSVLGKDFSLENRN